MTPFERNHWRYTFAGLGENECWHWTGVKKDNYGKLMHEGKSIGAHRLSYMLHKGEIPKGLFVCHTCDNKSCVNPKHLYAGTRYDNMKDAVVRGRMPRGIRHGSKTYPKAIPRGESVGTSKLDDKKVEKIREMLAAGLTNRAIGKKFNVHHSTIGRIRTGVTWRPVEEEPTVTITKKEYERLLAALEASEPKEEPCVHEFRWSGPGKYDCKCAGCGELRTL